MTIGAQIGDALGAALPPLLLLFPLTLVGLRSRQPVHARGWRGLKAFGSAWLCLAVYQLLLGSLAERYALGSVLSYFVAPLCFSWLALLIHCSTRSTPSEATAP